MVTIALSASEPVKNAKLAFNLAKVTRKPASQVTKCLAAGDQRFLDVTEIYTNHHPADATKLRAIMKLFQEHDTPLTIREYADDDQGDGPDSTIDHIVKCDEQYLETVLARADDEFE